MRSLSTALLTTLLLSHTTKLAATTCSNARSHLTQYAHTMASQFNVKPQRSDDRDHTHIDWLNSYHSFPFGGNGSYGSKPDSFHSLRVINEDRVKAGEGFPTHRHSEFEIYSYIVSGQLSHRDSMGSDEVMSRGDIQHTTGGTGISHSEYNRGKQLVHFLQIWCKPKQSRVKPSYQTKHFSDEQKLNCLLPIVTESGNDGAAIKINSAVDVYASLLENDATVTHTIRPGRDYYIHVVQDVTGFDTEDHVSSIVLDNGVTETELKSGDGAFITQGQPGGALKITGKSTQPDKRRTEFILFDLQRK